MTHEQWNKHHAVMEWFYAEEGRSVFYKYNTKSEWYIATSGMSWEVTKTYVPNDEYVEFRKALVEGKVVEFVYDFIRAVPAFAPIKEPIERYALEYLRIKPDEPKFKVGNWVRDIHSNEILQVLELFSKKLTCKTWAYSCYIHN